MTTLAAPLRVEYAALRGATTPVVRTGMGPRRSARSAARLAGPVLVAGVGGGLAEPVRVGDVVVATEVHGGNHSESTVACPSAPLLAGALRRLGLTVHCGPIRSSRTLATGADRGGLAGTGAIAVDMESAWLAPADGSPFAVVRAISDTAGSSLVRPALLRDGWAALRSLRRAVPALDAWAAAVGPRSVLFGRDAECDLFIEDAGDVALEHLVGVARIAVTAEASARPHLVDDLLAALGGLGPLTLREGPLPEEVT